MATALALDLGSTGIKAGSLTDTGELVVLGKRPAPPLTGTGLIREGDPEAYRDAATELLNLAQLTAPTAPIGIASQRSSFLLWEAASGQPVTPMISWQDRRAEAWCAAHARSAERWPKRTGLVLSPHYVGPKLATLLAADPALKRGLVAGELLFGTLETYLIWSWSGGRVHHTDLSMAARTMLVAHGGGAWDRGLLKAFGIPRTGLPHIGPSVGLSIAVGTGHVAATLSDQAAAVLSLPEGAALVNLGTGGFVLLPGGPRRQPPTGFLAGPLWGDGMAGNIRPQKMGLEGTINGIGPALEAVRGEAGDGTADLYPNHFCLPDASGIGAPHWRADMGTVWTDDLPTDGRYRVMLEGIVFRVWEMVSAMAPKHRPARLMVAGGIANEPFVAPALAACSGIAVERLLEPEATLVGAAMMAARPAGPSMKPIATEPVAPLGDYLPKKYRRWRRWLAGVMG